MGKYYLSDKQIFGVVFLVTTLIFAVVIAWLAVVGGFIGLFVGILLYRKYPAKIDCLLFRKNAKDEKIKALEKELAELKAKQ